MKNIDSLALDKTTVLKFLGYGNRAVPEIIGRKLNEEIEKLDAILEPEINMREFKISAEAPEKIVLGDNYLLEGTQAFKQLKDSEVAYIVLYTVGHKIEEEIARYTQNLDMMRAMILDKLGIVALDAIRDKIKAEIRAKNPGLNIAAELYAGEGDFALSNQKLIYKMLEAQIQNISIGEACQFSPLKTVGVIFGLGKEKNTQDRCENCKTKCH